MATSELSNIWKPFNRTKVSFFLSAGVNFSHLSACILISLAAKTPAPTDGSAKGIAIPERVWKPSSSLFDLSFLSSVTS